MAEKEQGSQSPSILKRKRLPGGSQGSRARHDITEKDSVTATINMTPELVSQVQTLRQAMDNMSQLGDKMESDANAKDEDQLMQVKEIYVAMVKVIVTKRAILDDSPTIIQNRTVTIKGKEITNSNDVYPRIDQTRKFFEEQGFKEDPAFAFDRAVALYVSRREALKESGVDVDGQVISYLDGQRKGFILELAQDKIDHAAGYIKQYIAKKGKLYNEITDIHEYLDELNLLMGSKKSNRKFSGMDKGDLRQVLERQYVEVARCIALQAVGEKFQFGASWNTISFGELKRLYLTHIEPAAFIKNNLTHHESLYKCLKDKAGPEGVKEIAVEVGKHMQENAKTLRITGSDIVKAVSRIMGTGAKAKAGASGAGAGEDAPGSGHA